MLAVLNIVGQRAADDLDDGTRFLKSESVHSKKHPPWVASLDKIVKKM